MPKKPKHETTIRSAAAEYLTFVSTIGDQPGSVELRYEDENIWLTQRLMAELYGVSVPAISQHIKQIYGDNELDKGATVKKYLIVQNEGGRQIAREVNHYSLQMIIVVGFKVNNEQILKDAGRISAELAKAHAESEFEKFRIVQDQLYQSDFDRFLQLEQSVKGLYTTT